MESIMAIELWLLMVAAIYTYVGYIWGRRQYTEEIVECTIDSLISDGYLFVKRDEHGDEVELVKVQDIIDKK